MGQKPTRRPCGGNQRSPLAEAAMLFRKERAANCKCAGIGAQLVAEGSVKGNSRRERSIILPASAVELGARLDGQRLVLDVAFHVRRGHQGDDIAVDGAEDLAQHDHALADDSAFHLTPLTDHNLVAGHIAFELAIDLEPALADNFHAAACKLQVTADYHLGLTEHGEVPFFFWGKRYAPLASKVNPAASTDSSRLRLWTSCSQSSQPAC